MKTKDEKIRESFKKEFDSSSTKGDEVIDIGEVVEYNDNLEILKEINAKANEINKAVNDFNKYKDEINSRIDSLYANIVTLMTIFISTLSAVFLGIGIINYAFEKNFDFGRVAVYSSFISMLVILLVFSLIYSVNKIYSKNNCHEDNHLEQDFTFNRLSHNIRKILYDYIIFAFSFIFFFSIFILSYYSYYKPDLDKIVKNEMFYVALAAVLLLLINYYMYRQYRKKSFDDLKAASAIIINNITNTEGGIKKKWVAK